MNARRNFLKTGTAAAAAGIAGGILQSTAKAQDLGPQSTDSMAMPMEAHSKQTTPGVPKGSNVEAEYEGFSRFKPTRGNDPDSDYYLGKLVPGFRGSSEGAVSFEAPDIPKLPYRMDNGVKVFELVPQAVQREFHPGVFMNLYGYNGSMPGPTIEVTQGDRIRIVVTNELPEPTFVHWHGFEVPVQWDGAATLVQNPIEPGKSFVYEFDIHEYGTFFYHSHVTMQETMGQVGFFIVHPKKVFEPPVDRDFGLLFQNFHIDQTQTINDSWSMDWNWHTINGRSGPYTTPLVCKHGERVRVRLLDFSPMQHHPVHLHGHTFWVTGHEASRIPKSAWIPRNTELIAVAQSSDIEFVANNPGDWMFHCHMMHHTMNHMVRHVGPRMRNDESVDQYLSNVDYRPRVDANRSPEFDVPGYPQKMQGMSMSKEFMKGIWSRKETRGMRANYPMSVKGLMTVMRVLPDDLYDLVMNDDRPIEKGSVFAEIVRRFGDPSKYESGNGGMSGMKM